MFHTALTPGGVWFVCVVAILGAAVVALCFADWRRSCECQEKTPTADQKE